MKSTCALILSASALLASCSAFVSSRQTVTIRAVPEEARISVDGRLVGTGAASVELERDHSHLVLVEHGGKQEVRVIDHVWSRVGKLDALSSLVLIFPGIGLLFAGARSLEPRDLTIEMP